MRRRCRVFRWGDQLLIGPRRALWRLSDHTGEFGEQPHTDYTGIWATTRIQAHRNTQTGARTHTQTHTPIHRSQRHSLTQRQTHPQKHKYSLRHREWHTAIQTYTDINTHTDTNTDTDTHAHTHLLQTKMGNHKDYNWIDVDRGGHWPQWVTAGFLHLGPRENKEETSKEAVFRGEVGEKLDRQVQTSDIW